VLAEYIRAQAGEKIVHELVEPTCTNQLARMSEPSPTRKLTYTVVKACGCRESRARIRPLLRAFVQQTAKTTSEDNLAYSRLRVGTTEVVSHIG
jgi:hypothetical protein